jgi:hypothetical protein
MGAVYYQSPNHIRVVIPNAAVFFAAEEPVLSEAEGISVSSIAVRQPNSV